MEVQDFGKPVVLSENNPLTFFPKIAISGDKIYTTWVTIYSKGTEKESVEVSFAKSIDGGNTFEKPLNLTTNSKISLDPQFASSGNKVYVAWTNGTIVPGGFPMLSDTMIRYSNNSGQTFQDTISLNNYTGWSINPMIKSIDNKLFIIWTEKDHNKNAIYIFVLLIANIQKDVVIK